MTTSLGYQFCLTPSNSDCNMMRGFSNPPVCSIVQSCQVIDQWQCTYAFIMRHSLKVLPIDWVALYTK